MQVFISWSEDRSRQIAEAIRNWLPKVIQSVKPWMSNEDIGAGARWLTEVSTILNNAKVGLICITPENQHNPWLLFEAGALSKTLEQTCVCPLIFEMTPGQLKGPLTQFQANVLDREGIGKVLSTINKSLGDQMIDLQQLEEILDVWWPKLEEKLKAIPSASTPTAARSTNDQLEELLLLGREQMRRENIRLEASKDRDAQVDAMIGYMNNAQATMSVLRNSMQQVIPKGLLVEKSPLNIKKHLADSAHIISESMTSGDLSASAIEQMSNLMQEMQEREKTRREDMLNPPIEGSNPS